MDPADDPDDLLSRRLDHPGSYQLAVWTLKLANAPAFQPVLLTDPQMFSLFYACCASAIEPPRELASYAEVDSAAALSVVHEDRRLTDTIKDLQRQFGPNISGRFASLFLQGAAVYGRLLVDGKMEDFAELLSEWVDAADEKSSSWRTSLDDNLAYVTGLLKLDTTEADLLNFQFNRHNPGFGTLFNLLLNDDQTAPVLLGLMLGHDTSRILDALAEDATLVRSGLVSVQRRPFRLEAPSAYMRSTFESPAEDESEFWARFVRPLEPESTTASLARLDKRDSDILKRMLKLKLPKGEGLHALVYGTKNMDKQDMVSRELVASGFEVHGVVTTDVPSSDLPTWVYISQSYLKSATKKTVLVIRKAERALASRTADLMVMFGLADPNVEERGKASDESLTGAQLRCVWLTDDAEFLTEKNLGRFLFHCEALTGSRSDRRQRVAEVVKEFGLSESLERELAKYTLLGDRQVRQAALLGSSVGRNPEDSEAVITRAVEQAQKALGRDTIEELRESVTAYSLDNLNLAGKYDAATIISALKKRQGKAGNTLCFYGIPGAGKTQLAEVLAVELDVPIVMKRASDLLSKWLGESEKAIAGMFREAEAEGAMLFLDEADSFLRDRSLARAEWSVTQVNELLQQMERFPGVFIAATNLFQDLDAAALRRFTFKVEFQALTSDQAWEMFVVESGYDVKLNPDEARELRERVVAIANLTPGDFATVKRQANLMGEAALDVDDWVTQLQEEAKVKMHGLARNKLGFDHGAQ